MSTDEEIDYSDSPTSEPGLLEALYPVSHAAALKAERAVGWREAAEEIRRVRDQQDGWLWFEVGERLLTMVADHLESIAPGRTTP